MRYNRLTDLGLTEKQITDNLMFASDKIGQTMTVAITPAEGKAWFGNPPPDLSVEARIRGRDWLYSYLLGFYRDDKSATGWTTSCSPTSGCRTCCGNCRGRTSSSKPNTRITRRRWVRPSQ
jgi:ubiquinol-cytochrome c reductase cytochrome c1 subunit